MGKNIIEPKTILNNIKQASIFYDNYIAYKNNNNELYIYDIKYEGEKKIYNDIESFYSSNRDEYIYVTINNNIIKLTLDKDLNVIQETNISFIENVK